MKRTFLIAAALASFAAFAQEQEAPAAPKTLTLKLVKQSLEREKMTVYTALPKMFEDPDEEANLKALRNRLGERLLPAWVGYVYKIDPNDSRNMGEIKELVTVFKVMDTDVRPRLRSLVHFYIVGQFASRYAKLCKVYKRLDNMEVAADLLALDRACSEFCKRTREMENGHRDDRNFFRFVNVSKLDQFCDEYCERLPIYDRLFRSVDLYLAQIDKPTLDELSTNAHELEGQVREVRKAVAEGRAVCAKCSAYPKVEVIFDKYDAIVDMIESVGGTTEEIVKYCNDTSTDVGKIRAVTPLTPNKFLLAAGSPPSNGCPIYARRFRRAIQECRDSMRSAIRSVNEYHKGESGFTPLIWDGR